MSFKFDLLEITKNKHPSYLNNIKISLYSEHFDFFFKAKFKTEGTLVFIRFSENVQETPAHSELTVLYEKGPMDRYLCRSWIKVSAGLHRGLDVLMCITTFQNNILRVFSKMQNIFYHSRYLYFVEH